MNWAISHLHTGKYICIGSGNQTKPQFRLFPPSSLTGRASCPWWDVRDPAGLHYCRRRGSDFCDAICGCGEFSCCIHLIACYLFWTTFFSWQNYVLGSILLAEEDANYSRGILSSFFFVWPVRHILCLRGLVRTEAWPKCKKTFYSNEASGFGLEVKNWKKWKRHFGKIRETSFLPFYLWNTDNAGPVNRKL